MKVYNPNAEERAFLYQEAQSLEPLIRNIGSLTVVVEEVPAKKADADKFRVTFVVAPETGGLRIQATDRNIYDATILAKAETERQLNTLINAMPRPLGQEERMPLDLMH